MLKRIMYVSIVALVLGMVGVAQAGNTISVSSKTGDWNAVIWDNGFPPAAAGDSALLIDSHLTLSNSINGLSNVYVGYVLASSLTVNEGVNLTVEFTEYVPSHACVGVLDIYGTNVAHLLRVGNEVDGAQGTVNVYSGGLLESGLYNVTEIGRATGDGYGVVNLIGTGNMDVRGGAGLVILNTGSLDIEAGKLRVQGDQIAALTAYIANGKITGYGHVGNVNAPILGTGADTGWTVVTAIFCGGLKADLNNDCYVNFADIAMLAESWLTCNDPQNPECFSN